MEQTITFKLEDFEGPLDLLLYLVSKNKMNIYDIEIVALIDQYVSMVNGLPVYQMESASEFIEMAARLVQMKSYFLLPKSEEAERMKEELTGMLVEYSACKEVAAQLRSMPKAYIPWCVNRPRSTGYRVPPASRCISAGGSVQRPAGTQPSEAAAPSGAVRTAYHRAFRFRHLTYHTCAARLDDRPCQAASPAVRQGGGAQPDRGYVPRGSGTGARRTHRHRGRRSLTVRTGRKM